MVGRGAIWYGGRDAELEVLKGAEDRLRKGGL